MISLEEIIFKVSDVTGVSIDDIIGRCRNSEISEARNIYYRVCDELGHKREDYTRYIGRSHLMGYALDKIWINQDILNRARQALGLYHNIENTIFHKSDMYTIHDVTTSGYPLFLVFKNGEYQYSGKDRDRLKKKIIHDSFLKDEDAVISDA